MVRGAVTVPLSQPCPLSRASPLVTPWWLLPFPDVPVRATELPPSPWPLRSVTLSLLLFLLLCPPAQRSGFAGFGSQPSVDYQAVRVHAGEVTFLSEPSYACCFLKSQLGFPTSSPSDSVCVLTELLLHLSVPMLSPQLFPVSFLSSNDHF